MVRTAAGAVRAKPMLAQNEEEDFDQHRFLPFLSCRSLRLVRSSPNLEFILEAQDANESATVKPTHGAPRLRRGRTNAREHGFFVPFYELLDRQLGRSRQAQNLENRFRKFFFRPFAVSVLRQTRLPSSPVTCSGVVNSFSWDLDDQGFARKPKRAKVLPRNFLPDHKIGDPSSLFLRPSRSCR
jgi:hypothetical protein